MPLPSSEDSTTTSPQHRIALCIGNSKYDRSPLTNPVHDATDLADYLIRQLRFTVAVALDATRQCMETEVERFTSSIQPDSVVVLSFHGHGCEVDGVNYLMPITDASTLSDADIRYRGVSAQWMLEKVGERKPAFVLFILDACRSNPFRKSRSGCGGLAQMEPLGSLLLYACAPGHVALDGIGTSRNSPLVTHLMRHLHAGEVHSAVRKVIKAVHASTNETQKPWHHSDVTADFYFGAAEINVPLLLDELRLYSEQREVRSIVSFMQQHASVALLYERACEALASIAKHKGNCALVAGSGGIEAAVAALRHYPSNAKVQHSAKGGLAPLMVDIDVWDFDTMETKISVLSVVNRDDIVSVMKEWPAHKVLQVRGCVLLYLRANMSDTRDLGHDAALECLIAAMRLHVTYAPLQYWACKTLSYFAIDDDCCRCIVSSGGIECLVAAMRQHPAANSTEWYCPNIQRHACCALRQLARPALYKQIVSAGALDCAVAAMAHDVDEPRTQQYACGLLAKLACDATSRALIVQSGAVPAIVAAMRRWPTDVAVQAFACSALHRMSDSKASRDAIISAAAMEQLLAAAKQTFNPGIQRSACGALAVLARDASTSKLIDSAGGRKFAQATIYARQ